MGDITDLTEREKSIRNFKKKILKKGKDKGFLGYDDKDSFNKVVKFD